MAYSQKDIKSANTQAQKKYEEGKAALAYTLYEKALEEFKDAIKIDPAFAAAYQQSADIYKTLKQ